MSSFIPRNLTEIEAVTGCTFVCICNTVFRMFSCLQINCQPFYLSQLLKFHLFDWLIEIYLKTEGQDTHHKMVSLQPMPGFSLCWPKAKLGVENTPPPRANKVKDVLWCGNCSTHFQNEMRQH